MDETPELNALVLVAEDEPEISIRQQITVSYVITVRNFAVLHDANMLHG